MDISTRLRSLDELYYTGSLGDYGALWESVAEQVARDYPGFTLAYGEVYTAGRQRTAHGGMRHVIIPESSL